MDDADFVGGSCGVQEQLPGGIQNIYSTGYAFVAVKSDGSVVPSGDANAGGSSRDVQDRVADGIQHIYSTWPVFFLLQCRVQVL